MKTVKTMALIIGLVANSMIMAQTIPGTLSYQGILMQSDGITPLADGSHTIVFKFYTVASGGSALAGLDRTVSANTTKGLFTCIIGGGTSPNAPFSASDMNLLSSQQIYIGISVDGGTELVPRAQTTPATYALQAQSAYTISDNAVTSAKIADGSIVNADINTGAAIADTKLATISTVGKVSGNAITTGTISGNTNVNSTGNITASSFTGNGSALTAIGSPAIQDGSLVNDDISASAAIADSKLATISTPGKVLGDAITSGIITGTSAINTTGNILTTGNISTGTTASTNRLTVNGGTSIGNSYISTAAPSNGLIVQGAVGIGTSSPDSKLHINTSGNGSTFVIGTDVTIEAINTNISGFGASSGLNFIATHGLNSYAWGISTYAGSSGSDALRISGPNGTGGFIMYINSASVRPAGNNTTSLGTSSNRWTAVHATNGTIQTSDLRLKENIVDLNYGITELLKFRPVSYSWRGEDNRKLGLIAQEILLVTPEVVSTPEKDADYYGVNYSEIVPILIKSIQEQQAQIEKLKSINSTLEKRVASLEANNTSTKMTDR